MTLPVDALAAIEAAIGEVEGSAAIREEARFAERTAALDRLDLHVLDRIDGLLEKPAAPSGLHALRARAERARRALEEVDEALFARLRASIRSGACRGAALRAAIEEYGRSDPDRVRGPGEPGYDALDAFVDGLLAAGPIPGETRVLEPEMVSYQGTPARVVLELAERLGPLDGALFHDLGSGLGHVPILVSLLTGARARGVEIEPAYCAYARACAARLALAEVDFREADAREADYSAGSVFFLYTPFRGEILRGVLESLRRESRGRVIRLFSYGPCTADLSRERWLVRVGTGGDDPHRLAEFRSIHSPGASPAAG